MAIKVGGTQVISNSQGLTNISSIDATTAAAIGAAGVGGGTSIDLVADGSISAGDPVGVTSAGKAKKVSQLYGAKQDNLTPFGIYYMGHAIYDTTANVFLYSNRTDSGGYKCFVQAFDLSGFTISAGTAVDFSNSSGYSEGHHLAHNPTDGKNLVVYFTSSTGYAHSFTCSGTTITKGGAYSLSTTNGQPMVSYNPDQNNYLYCFRSGSTYQGGKILTTSSSNYNVGVGSAYNLASGNYYGAAVVYDTTANKHVLFTALNGSSVSAIVVTNNGSSLSAGSPVSTGSTSHNGFNAIFDPYSGKTIIAYGQGSTGMVVRTVTVSGTSVTLGSPLALTNHKDFSSQRPHLAVDGNGNIVLVFLDSLISGVERVTSLVVDGTDIVAVNTFLAHNMGSANGDNGAGGLAYSPDDGKFLQITGVYNQSKDLYAIDVNSPYATFIGFAQSTVSNGSTVTIDLIGSENTNQSGLTTGLAYGIDATTGNLSAPASPKVAIATGSTKALVIGGTA